MISARVQLDDGPEASPSLLADSRAQSSPMARGRRLACLQRSAPASILRDQSPAYDGLIERCGGQDGSYRCRLTIWRASESSELPSADLTGESGSAMVIDGELVRRGDRTPEKRMPASWANHGDRLKPTRGAESSDVAVLKSMPPSVDRCVAEVSKCSDLSRLRRTSPDSSFP